MARPRKNLNGLASAASGLAPVHGDGASAVNTGTPVDLEQVPEPPPPPLQQPDEEETFTIRDLPLFAGTPIEGSAKNRPSYVSVFRIGPVSEGHLGNLEPTSNEEDIKRRWGGGSYRIQLRSEAGSAIKHGQKDIHISGEPYIQSQNHRAEYERMVRNQNGLPAAPPPPQPLQLSPVPQMQAAPAAPPDTSLVSLLVALIQSSAAAQAASQQTMITMITESARSREESQFRMLELLTKKTEETKTTNPVDILKEGMKLGRALFKGGGDGEKSEPDAASKFIDAIPGILSGVKDVVKAEKAAPASATQVARAQGAGAAGLTPELREQAFQELGSREDVVLFEGEVGRFGNEALAHLTSFGVDHEKAFKLLFGQLRHAPRVHLEAMGLLLPEPGASPAATVPQERPATVPQERPAAAPPAAPAATEPVRERVDA